MNKIHIIGIGFRPLDRKAGDTVLESEAVLTNNRLLEVFKNYEEYARVRDKIIVHDSVYEMLDYISDNYMEKKIALLAAGDPMFFGIGRLVIERFGRDVIEVFPDLSSIQVAFSKISETSNNALMISLHGGPDPAKKRKLEYEIDEIPSLLAKHNKIAILTDKVRNPAVIARVLYESSALPHFRASALQMYVCEKLGYPDEKITEGMPEKIAGMSFADPNVVVIIQNTDNSPIPPLNKGGQGGVTSQEKIIFGLKENEISHTRGLITKDEVRAVTMHKLRIPERGVLWDIGAGSGSVSVEAARLSPDLKVLAVEKDEEQINNIVININRFNITNIEVVKGEAPEALKALPSPDRVFIGGSGGKLEGIIDSIKNCCELKNSSLVTRHSSLIIVINATTIETLNEAVHGFGKNNFIFELSEISVSRSKMVGSKRHMSALNPVFVIVGRK